MNGIVATSMREKGMDYRMNFGVTVPELRKIAAEYEPDARLADELWRRDVREFKILATLLYPVHAFFKETAIGWAYDIPNQEIREQLCMNLLQKTPFADELVQEWIGQDNESIRTTGYWLFARLVIIQSPLVPKIDANNLIQRAVTDVYSSFVFLMQASVNALKYAGRLSEENAIQILDCIREFEQSDLPQHREVFRLLSFEFGRD